MAAESLFVLTHCDEPKFSSVTRLLTYVVSDWFFIVISVRIWLEHLFHAVIPLLFLGVAV